MENAPTMLDAQGLQLERFRERIPTHKVDFSPRVQQTDSLGYQEMERATLKRASKSTGSSSPRSSKRIALQKPFVEMRVKGRSIRVTPTNCTEQFALGIGTFGYVHCVKHQSSEIKMACKKVKLYRDDNVHIKLEDDRGNKFNKFPFGFVEYYGCMMHNNGQELWVYTEMMDCSLLDLNDLVRHYCRKSLPEPMLGAIFHQVLDALKLVPCTAFHGNIKPSNILLNGKGEVKLCDFAFVHLLHEGSKRMGPFARHLYYEAPENWNGVETRAKSGDVWSVGMSAYAMALGEYPFYGPEERVKSSIMQSQFQLPIDSGYSIDYQKFIDECLRIEPEKRLSVYELLELKLFKEPLRAIDLAQSVQLVLTLRPARPMD